MTQNVSSLVICWQNVYGLNKFIVKVPSIGTGSSKHILQNQTRLLLIAILSASFEPQDIDVHEKEVLGYRG